MRRKWSCSQRIEGILRLQTAFCLSFSKNYFLGETRTLVLLQEYLGIRILDNIRRRDSLLQDYLYSNFLWEEEACRRRQLLRLIELLFLLEMKVLFLRSFEKKSCFLWRESKKTKSLVSSWSACHSFEFRFLHDFVKSFIVETFRFWFHMQMRYEKGLIVHNDWCENMLCNDYTVVASDSQPNELFDRVYTKKKPFQWLLVRLSVNERRSSCDSFSLLSMTVATKLVLHE